MCLDVIASAAKQSILSLRGEMDCFAALAMTVSKFHVFGSLKFESDVRDSGRVVQGLAWAGGADRRPVLKIGRLRWTLVGAERPALTDDGAAGDLSTAARPAALKEDDCHA